MSELPKLRSGLEAIPIKHEGQPLIVLRDALGFSEETLIISPDVYYIVSLMDGTNSALDIQEAYMRKYGALLFSEKIQEILDILDSYYFLDNERFAQFKNEIIEAFKKSTVRKPYLAGKAYPCDTEEAKKTLQLFFHQTRTDGQDDRSLSCKELLAIVAPHIDLKRGARCYAQAYRALSYVKNPPEIFVILGIGHEPIENFFAVSEKDFETPLGISMNQRDMVNELVSSMPRDIAIGEFAHRKEHSIEFQVLFLQYMLPDAKIVPILCSFGLDEWRENLNYILKFVAVLADIIGSYDAKIALIAGVDLEHIGPRYGDNFRPSNLTVSDAANFDSSILDMLSNLDTENFMDKVSQDNDRRKICGVPALFVMAETLRKLAIEGLKGKVLCYDKAVVDGYNSFVTFASMVFGVYE